MLVKIMIRSQLRYVQVQQRVSSLAYLEQYGLLLGDVPALTASDCSWAKLTLLCSVRELGAFTCPVSWVRATTHSFSCQIVIEMRAMQVQP